MVSQLSLNCGKSYQGLAAGAKPWRATLWTSAATIWPLSRNETALSRLMDHLRHKKRVTPMNSIIYIVGLIVIVMAILSFIGLA